MLPVEKDEVLCSYQLSQNYQNPFNPDTRIDYTLPRAGNVKLTIYNILGQPIRTLVNAKQEAGPYSIDWDGRDMTGHAIASGVYFYNLETGSSVESRKMLLLK